MCSLIRAQCVSLLSDIRDDYILYIRPRVAVEAKHYAQGSPVQRVRCAALAEGPNGRKHKHQWRIPPAALEKFSALLIARVGDITAARTFAELLGLIKSARTKGVAELTVYDTAVRIGKGQGLEPQAIYLHAGTREGARLLGWNVNRPSIPIEEIPPDLAGLTPAEIEDLLCSNARYFGPNASPYRHPTTCAPASKTCSTAIPKSKRSC